MGGLSSATVTTNVSGQATAPAFTANGVAGSYVDTASVTGLGTLLNFNLSNLKFAPIFSSITSPSITYGTATTTLTGKLAAGSSIPAAGIVSITLNSVIQTASVGPSGDFSAVFNTTTLGVAGSPYVVTYAFAGNSTFNAATDSSTAVTVTRASLTVTANPQSKTYGSTLSLAGTEFTSFGLKNSETIGSVILSSAGTNATAVVGSYTISVSAATGGTFTPTNYTVSTSPAL